MNILASGFHKAKEGQGSLETARNKVRHLLHQRNSVLFSYGQVGTPVSEMTENLLRSDNIIASTWIRCMDCNDESSLHDDLQTCVIQCISDCDCTTSTCLQKRFKDHYPRKKCVRCNGGTDKIMQFNVVLKILVFSVANPSVQVSKRIGFRDGESVVVFTLKGIVYFGDFHYTAWIFTHGSVWYNDGMVSGRASTYEKQICEFTDQELSTCNGKTLALVFYAQG